YTALVVTLDTPLLSWRPRDLDQAYLPFLHGVGTANYFTDPAFRAGLAKPVHEDPNAAVMHFVGMFSDPAKTWPDLAFLRGNWDGPIVLKGILHPDDARLAADAGMDGVVVSNHGGRQVAGSVAAADALPRVAEAVGDRLDVRFGRAAPRRGGVLCQCGPGPARRAGPDAGAVGARRAGHGGTRRPRGGPRLTRPPARPTAGRPGGVRPRHRRAGRAALGGAGADIGRSGSPRSGRSDHTAGSVSPACRAAGGTVPPLDSRSSSSRTGSAAQRWSTVRSRTLTTRSAFASVVAGVRASCSSQRGCNSPCGVRS